MCTPLVLQNSLSLVRVLSFAFMAGAGFIGLMPSSANAACLKDDREVKFKDGSAKLRSYLCDAGEGGASSLMRVEFHRLSEAAAGSILMATPYPDVQLVLGTPRVVANEVQAAAAIMFTEFGNKTTEATCYRFVVDVPKGGKAFDSSRPKHKNFDDCNKKKDFWYLSYPDQEGMTFLQFPLPNVVAHIRTKSDWPEGYNFFYSDCELHSNIECTNIWRYVRPGEMANLAANQKAFEVSLGVNGDNASDQADDTSAVQDRKPKKEYQDLIGYFEKTGLPDDFLVVVGSYEACGAFDFLVHYRQMVLDVATIENLSKQAVKLDSLLGALDKHEKLRVPLKSGTSPAATASPIAGSKVVLQPGEKVLVPLRMNFVSPVSLRDVFSKPEAAQKRFTKIQSAAPGTVFKEKGPGDDGKRINKTRESFGSPSAPVMKSYIYGPEVDLKGVVVAGKKIGFDEISSNFLQVTAGDGYGSCPYLYAYDAKTQAWTRYGKVIHEANAKDKELTQEIPLAGWATKFRIAEEELELSHIDKVALKLEMRDGSFFTLKPDHPVLAEADATRVQISAGKYVAFEFRPPSWIDAQEIKHASLMVTGFYERYSTMRMSER